MEDIVQGPTLTAAPKKNELKCLSCFDARELNDLALSERQSPDWRPRPYRASACTAVEKLKYLRRFRSYLENPN